MIAFYTYTKALDPFAKGLEELWEDDFLLLPLSLMVFCECTSMEGCWMISTKSF
jgi:hypothetical protein